MLNFKLKNCVTNIINLVHDTSSCHIDIDMYDELHNNGAIFVKKDSNRAQKKC